jgi:hypothetical protein
MPIDLSHIGSYQVFLPLLSIVMSIITLIIGLDCIWRVEKRLKTFLIVLTGAVIVTALRKITGLLGLDQSASWHAALLYSDLLVATLVLSAYFEIYRIIRSLNNEKPSRDGRR